MAFQSFATENGCESFFLDLENIIPVGKYINYEEISEIGRGARRRSFRPCG
jgi:hypothetical protein